MSLRGPNAPTPVYTNARTTLAEVAGEGDCVTLDFWFGQFNAVRGAVQEEGPYVGVFEGGVDQPDAVAVYVLVEPCGGASADLCAAAIEVIARGFGDGAQPLTASLLRAINAANAYVRAHRPVGAGTTFGIGVTVFAARGAEAYVAQAGPALACVRTAGATRVLEPPGDEAARPVGSDSRVTPSFARLRLATGDSALLLFASGADLIDHRRLAQLVAQPPERALPDVYLRVRGIPEFAALYLAVTGERRAALAVEPARGRGSRTTIAPRRSSEPVLPDATGTERLVAEAKPGGNEQRNGHGPLPIPAVRTITPRRTPLGTMAPVNLPITRRRLGIVGALAGIGLLLLLVLPGIARQGKNEKFNQLVRGADEAVAAAEREPDVARRRVLLERAQATVDEARTLRSVTPTEFAGLERRLSDQLAEIDRVRELADLVPVADLAAPGIAAPSATQVVAGPALYVLDATAGKVMAIQKEGEPRPVTIFEEGRPAGPNRTGRARHIAWWPAETNRAAALLVLDDQRRLYAVDVRGDIRPIGLGDTGEWKGDTAIAMGASHLYVLDAAANQLWRYALNAGGFPGAAEPLLGQRAVLRDASGLSIAATPLIAMPDGRLLRVTDGREQPLQPVALDRPLLAPAAPILNTVDGLLYIADRGNQRIVLLSPDGTFRGQLVSHRLAGLQSVALDESTNTLYAIAGQSLVKATIPR